MSKSVALTLLAVALSGAMATARTADAQSPSTAKPAATPQAATKPAEPAAAKPAEPPAQPVNIKIEVSITDQTGTSTPARKVVSMIAADRQSTFIRSSASVPVKAAFRNVTINVDARPSIVVKEPNKVLLSIGLEYLPRSVGGQEEMEAGMATLSERLGLILESGKSMIISQAADPTSDRKITVEVTATILK